MVRKRKSANPLMFSNEGKGDDACSHGADESLKEKFDEVFE